MFTWPTTKTFICRIRRPFWLEIRVATVRLCPNIGRKLRKCFQMNCLCSGEYAHIQHGFIKKLWIVGKEGSWSSTWTTVALSFTDLRRESTSSGFTCSTKAACRARRICLLRFIVVSKRGTLSDFARFLEANFGTKNDNKYANLFFLNSLR